jgi:hypothetical protein
MPFSWTPIRRLIRYALSSRHCDTALPRPASDDTARPGLRPGSSLAQRPAAGQRCSPVLPPTRPTPPPSTSTSTWSTSTSPRATRTASSPTWSRATAPSPRTRRQQTIKNFTQEKNLPLTIGILLDTSGSQMNVLPLEKESGATFLRDVLTPKDEAFLISFDINVDLLSDYTNRASEISRAMNKAQINTGAGTGSVTGNGTRAERCSSTPSSSPPTTSCAWRQAARSSSCSPTAATRVRRRR